MGRTGRGILINVKVFRAIEEPHKTSDLKRTYQEERERRTSQNLTFNEPYPFGATLGPLAMSGTVNRPMIETSRARGNKKIRFNWEEVNAQIRT